MPPAPALLKTSTVSVSFASCMSLASARAVMSYPLPAEFGTRMRSPFIGPESAAAPVPSLVLEPPLTPQALRVSPRAADRARPATAVRRVIVGRAAVGRVGRVFSEVTVTPMSW